MVRINWTREALGQIDLIRAYIGQFDPAAADRLATRLIGAGESLRDFPHRGRTGREGTRELAIIPPYVVIYEVRGNAVNVLSIKHGAQQR